jgi:hypothetical protein
MRRVPREGQTGRRLEDNSHLGRPRRERLAGPDKERDADQRQLSISSRSAAKVSVCDPGLTPGADRYPLYCPRT